MLSVPVPSTQTRRRGESKLGSSLTTQIKRACSLSFDYRERILCIVTQIFYKSVIVLLTLVSFNRHSNGPNKFVAFNSCRLPQSSNPTHLPPIAFYTINMTDRATTTRRDTRHSPYHDSEHAHREQRSPPPNELEPLARTHGDQLNSSVRELLGD